MFVKYIQDNTSILELFTGLIKTLQQLLDRRGIAIILEAEKYMTSYYFSS